MKSVVKGTRFTFCHMTSSVARRKFLITLCLLGNPLCTFHLWPLLVLRAAIKSHAACSAGLSRDCRDLAAPREKRASSASYESRRDPWRFSQVAWKWNSRHTLDSAARVPFSWHGRSSLCKGRTPMCGTRTLEIERWVGRLQQLWVVVWQIKLSNGGGGGTEEPCGHPKMTRYPSQSPRDDSFCHSRFRLVTEHVV